MGLLGATVLGMLVPLTAAHLVVVPPYFVSAQRPTIRLECPPIFGGISITSATFGGHLTATTTICSPAPLDNILEQMQADCDGLQICSIDTCICGDAQKTCPCPDKLECSPAAPRCFVDPASGCKKGFEAIYSCSGEWGVTFCAVFFPVMFAYLVGGYFYAVKVQGKPTAPLPHPHKLQWQSAHSLVADGITFARMEAVHRGWIKAEASESNLRASLLAEGDDFMDITDVGKPLSRPGWMAETENSKKETEPAVKIEDDGPSGEAASGEPAETHIERLFM